ncbi:hypothetical protein D9757_002826 [Collybiopsis confluens]|uniref:Pentatricopeptide repeat-containing protein n=1 Tax=Collybiopsis confluens TaxID=2823264 RepID=A0A8H5HVG6_9AGAR|nr:hypothetical protein D9757_002826 [Collybiopsis confluens]
MLRRAGLQRIGQATTRSQHLHPPLPAISVRCLPSAALDTRPEPLRPSFSGIPVSDPTPASTLDSQQNIVPDTPLLLALLSRKLSNSALQEEIRKNHLSLLDHLRDRTIARQFAETVALTPNFRFAVKVLNLAHEFGCNLKQNAYECTAYHLASNRHWHAVLAIVSLGERHTGTTTTRLLNWCIRALVETQQYAPLPYILEDFEKFQAKPNRRTLHLLISGNIRNRDLHEARKLLRLMSQIGLPPDSSTHALIASYYRDLGPNRQVQDQALLSLTTLDEDIAVTVLNRLIQLRLDAGDPAATLQILSVFNTEQVACIIKVIAGSFPSLAAEILLQSPSTKFTITGV